MNRTTIFLTDELHSNLKHLAIEKRCSMAELVRKAVEKVYKQDLKDLKMAQKAWKAHRKNPRGALTSSSYFSGRLKNA